MAVALKIFTGEAPAATPRDRQRLWSLREAFEAVLLPILVLKDRAKGTITGYYTTLRWWERVTSNPPICEIDDDQLTYFHSALPDELHGPRSRNKHTINVEAILRACGPRDSRNKRGKGILSEVPFCERATVGAPMKRRRIVPMEALAAIYESSSVATWPKHPTIPAPLVWRALWCLLWTFGLRRTNAFLLPADAIVREPQHPSTECDLCNDCGWLHFVPVKTRHCRPEPLTLPITPVFRRHLDALGQRKNRLLPFANCTRDWRDWSYRIQAAAGINQPYTFQDFRKTCNVTWNRLGGRRTLGKYVLGQVPRDVNTQFYEDFTEDVVKYSAQFPYPEIMQAGELL